MPAPSRPVAPLSAGIVVGATVIVRRPQRPFRGVVTRVNDRSVSIRGEDGRRWRVPRSFPMAPAAPGAPLPGPQPRPRIRRPTPPLPGRKEAFRRGAPGGGSRRGQPVVLARRGGRESIRYRNFDALAKISAHPLRKLHAIIDQAAAKCEKTWHWKASGLIFDFAWSTRVMGRSYRCGTGRQTGIRRIALSDLLIGRYDGWSVGRVVMHELCHHYRKETFPHGTSHDRIFCRELGRVDPLVAANRRQCARFRQGEQGKLKGRRAASREES
jgi:hypothetical protein